MSDEPVPNVAKQPLDLSAISKEATPRAFLSLADANVQYSFVHCVDCDRGGHTGHSLYTIIKDVTTRREAKACQDHASQYIRPKDLLKIKKRS